MYNNIYDSPRREPMMSRLETGEEYTAAQSKEWLLQSVFLKNPEFCNHNMLLSNPREEWVGSQERLSSKAKAKASLSSRAVWLCFYFSKPWRVLDPKNLWGLLIYCLSMRTCRKCIQYNSNDG